MSQIKKIIWTNTAKDELKTIFNFYKEKSVQGANRVKEDIFKTTSTIHFAEQYQKDEIEPEFRRIIVRDYKILYEIVDDVIYIARIYSTKLNPDRQL